MYKLRVCLLLIFVSLCIIQIECLSYANGKRAKRSAENFGPGSTQQDSDIYNICENTTMDATFYLDDGKLYVLKREYYWVVENDKIEPGYPKLVKDTWNGLPSPIDAALSYQGDIVFFFKGPIYWKYKGTKLEPGYPQLISDGFPGIPNDIDAASVWGKNGLIYFFKGSHYWRYEPGRVPHVKNAYPKAISDGWNGIPNDLDVVALSTHRSTKGVIYFVKGPIYWRFDDAKLTVYADSKFPYPRDVYSWWFSCPKADP